MFYDAFVDLLVIVLYVLVFLGGPLPLAWLANKLDDPDLPGPLYGVLGYLVGLILMTLYLSILSNKYGWSPPGWPMGP